MHILCKSPGDFVKTIAVSFCRTIELMYANLRVLLQNYFVLFDLLSTTIEFQRSFFGVESMDHENLKTL